MSAHIENGVNGKHDAQQAVRDAQKAVEDAKRALRKAKGALVATEIDVVLLILESAASGMFPDYDGLEYVTKLNQLGSVVVHRLVDGQRIDIGRDAYYLVEVDRVSYSWFVDGPAGGMWYEKPLSPSELDGDFSGSDQIAIYFNGPSAEANATAWLRKEHQLELPEA